MFIDFCSNLGHVCSFFGLRLFCQVQLCHGIRHPRCSSRLVSPPSKRSLWSLQDLLIWWFEAENHCHDVATCSNETSEQVHNRHPFIWKKGKRRPDPQQLQGQVIEKGMTDKRKQDNNRKNFTLWHPPCIHTRDWHQDTSNEAAATHATFKVSNISALSKQWRLLCLPCVCKD